VVPSETQITNLLYRYAECIDTGDFAGAASLFEHARIKVLEADGDGTIDASGVLDLWNNFIVRYPDGTPRTKHVITNPTVVVDEESGTASCRSYYTVFQQTERFGLQPIIAGRYHDCFERVGDVWRYCYRDYSLVGLVGDMSRHGARPVPG
jgi:3-phenylpropionate/cinnamic acid dioxygenase small subunit